MDLPIDVGLGNVIEIDQRHPANAATRKRLGHPGAHAANPDNAHVRGGESRQRSGTVQTRDAAKTACKIDIGFRHVRTVWGSRMEHRIEGSGHRSQGAFAPNTKVKKKAMRIPGGDEATRLHPGTTLGRHRHRATRWYPSMPPVRFLPTLRDSLQASTSSGPIVSGLG